MANPRVVLMSIDSFVPRHLTPERTPHFWALARSGGFAPEGGFCDLPSVTYPSHATLISGRHVGNHGVMTGAAGRAIPGVIPGWAGETHVARPTLFTAARDAGLTSAAVLGDQHLVDICDAHAATSCWPPDSSVPPEAERDRHGYRTNAAIHAAVLRAVADESFNFVFAHYNETDTEGHRYGPDAPETLVCYRETDRLVGEVIAALNPAWERTLLLVVSDHGMELLPEGPPFRLLDVPAVSAVALEEIDETGSALLRLRNNVTYAEAVAAIFTTPEVAAAFQMVPGVVLVEAVPDVVFGSDPPAKSRNAGHGGQSTARTLAIASGGHPAATAIAKAIATSPPHLADWAPTIAAVLGIALPDADGRDLSADSEL